MSLAVLDGEVYAPITVNAATNSTATYAPLAVSVAYVVVASASSSPVGTTIIIQGSIDGTSYAALTTAVTVTGDGVFTAYLTPGQCSYKYYRLAYARTSGSYVATTSTYTKGAGI